MTSCSASTTSGFPRRWSPGATSTAGGSKQRHETPDLLTLTEKDLLAADEDVAEAIGADFPDTWVQGDITLPLPVGIGPEITATVLAEFSGRDDQHGVAVGPTWP